MNVSVICVYTNTSPSVGYKSSPADNLCEAHAIALVAESNEADRYRF